MKTSIFIYPLLLTVVFVSCQKNTSPPQNGNSGNGSGNNSGQDSTKNASVYVAGIQQITNTIYAPVYWKNGQEVMLENGNGTALGIAVSGNDIYVVGHIDTGDIHTTNVTSFACYWKNGQLFNLGPGIANAIAISGNDVYIAGATIPSPTTGRACYWKNGQPVIVGPNESDANAVAVMDGNIYLAGIVPAAARSDFRTACYWKNGQLTTLTNGSNDEWAYGISVSGSDVYVCGYTPQSYRGEVSCYWKNGVQIIVNRNSDYSTAIQVTGSGDLYLTDREPGYWKNGQLFNLDAPGGTMYALALAVTGSNVYVAGIVQNNLSKNTQAAYWKNGELVNLPSGNVNSQALAIAVQ